MYSVNIGEDKLKVEVQDQGLLINGVLVHMDIEDVDTNKVHVINFDTKFEV